MSGYEVLSSPFHVGDPLSIDLTEEPHRRLTSEPVVLAVVRSVADAVARSAAEGGRPLVWAGDCVAPLGVVAGLQRSGTEPAGVVWLDAHGDFNTPATSPSGYLPGMALALLVGRGDRALRDALGLRAVPEDRVVLAGSRDLDPPEAEALDGSAITRVPVEGLDEAVRALGDGALYVHIDADVVDPEDLPGMRYPSPDGPSAETVVEALRSLTETGRVAAVSLGVTLPDDLADAATTLAGVTRLRQALG